MANVLDTTKYTPVSLSSVKNPSGILFVCDTPILDTTMYGSLYITNHLLNALDNAGSGAVTAFRHNSGGNFTMCDGHAKYYKRGQGPSISYYEYGQGKGKPFWDPAYWKPVYNCKKGDDFLSPFFINIFVKAGIIRGDIMKIFRTVYVILILFIISWNYFYNMNI